ncbi:ST6B1 Sulfotransferase, partial [Urocynchramus pylzowi]|nr:ST6B1 Sulfotransferase [Urocynchramus pylzowi]
IPFLRILITHLSYNHLPKSIFKEKGTIVVLFQNPKDRALLFLHFHNNGMQSVPSYSSRDEFFSGFMTDLWGSCFDPAVTWNKHIEDKNTVVIIYEDLKGNLTASVKQITAFFGFSPTAEQMQAIAGRHTFQPVSVKAQEIHGAVGLMLFHKAVFGDWKNVFAEAQNQKLAAKFTVCLEVAKMGVKFKYDVYCKA